MLYGYARVSTIDQDLSIQKAALSAAGCTVIREEKVSGTSTEGREELKTLFQFLRQGDTLVVTRIDRLERVCLRDGVAHGEHQPERGSVKHEPHLIGRRAVTRHAVRRHLRSLIRFSICPRLQ